MVSFGNENYKFGRTYNLVVNLYKIVSRNPFIKSYVDKVEIPFPLTLNFNISRGMDKKINTATFKLFNLAETTRAFLYKDNYDNKYLEIKLYAGYENQNNSNNPPLIFGGTIKDCCSYKASGSTEWTTEIEAWDGGMSFNLPIQNFGFGIAKKRELIEKAISGLPDVKLGSITNTIDLEKPLKKVQFVGNPFDFIKEIVGEKRKVFVDNGKLYVLDDNTCIKGIVEEISVDSGLLGSPKRKSGTMTVEMIFEPTILVGQMINLRSTTLPYLNGAYKIVNFTHEGTISGSTCGQLSTKIDLFVPPLEPLQEIDENNGLIWRKLA